MNGVGQKVIDANGDTTPLQPPIGVVGCRKRINTKELCQPQLAACERPFQWKGVAYEKNVFGQFSCNYCSATYDKENTIQQHCRLHFPTEYKCTECGDCFHLKGSWQNHFLRECDMCGKILKGNLASHRAKCKGHMYRLEEEAVELARPQRTLRPHAPPRCMARVWNGGKGVQCSKRRCDDSEFCKSHGKSHVRECSHCSKGLGVVIHQFAWEHHGRVDQPMACFYLNKSN